MTVQDYFQILGYDHHNHSDYFFVMAKAIKSETSPSYEACYKSTPVRSVSDWWGCDTIMDAIVLNNEAYAPEQVGVYWNRWVKNGRCNALLIVSPEDYEKLSYANVTYIENEIMKDLHEKGLIGKFKRDKIPGQVETFYIRENERMLILIRDTLVKDQIVEVHNAYDTFYGVGFDQWLRKGLEDIPCNIKVVSYDPCNDYPRTYLITFTGDIDELAGGAPHPRH